MKKETKQWKPTEFRRYRFLINLLQRKGEGKTVKEMKKALEREDPDLVVSERTIQRIMEYFAEEFGIESKRRHLQRGRPMEWRWGKYTEGLLIERMDIPSALVYELAGRLLTSVMPKRYLEEMKPRFNAARRHLNRHIGGASTKLTDKIRILPRGLARRPAAIDQKVLVDLYDALAKEKQVLIRYAPIALNKPDEMIAINPLGIVNRLDMMYLVANVEESEGIKSGIRELVIQRIMSTKVLSDCSALRPADFDLDRYLDDPIFMRNPFPGLKKLGKKFRLVAIFQEWTYPYVVERPFGYDAFDEIEGEKEFVSDQKVKKLPDGRWQIEATVKNTRELMSQLHDFAADVEVVSPKLLRNYFKGLGEQLSQTYEF